jgi:4-diphosphocytidyl-2-C-methyl-D-erythritol kinase
MYSVRSGSTVIIHAPAKLNLHLEVLGRRSDGYHELETLMAAIGVVDTLRISPGPPGNVRLVCRWAYGRAASSRDHGSLGELPPENENIVVRAVELLRRKAGIDAGARMELVKRIPSAAGLGGASSNAAAALLGANEIWKLGWPREQLAALASELGSDVPFFLNTGMLGPGAAICRGRGERIQAIPARCRLDCVVVRPPHGLSTPAVFKQCRPAEQTVSVEPMVAAIRLGNSLQVARNLMNRLEEPAASLSPWIERLLRELARVGSLGCRMSGSGSSCFGVFRHRRAAQRAARRLRAARLGTVYATALAAAPRRTRDSLPEGAGAREALMCTETSEE